MNAGLVLIVMGVVLTLVYFLVNSTEAGHIGELAGAGFMFLFLGVLSVLGEVMGIARSDEE
jgi:hypothetical protein